jgi:hypothetical protein
LLNYVDGLDAVTVQVVFFPDKVNDGKCKNMMRFSVQTNWMLHDIFKIYFYLLKLKFTLRNVNSNRVKVTKARRHPTSPSLWPNHTTTMAKGSSQLLQ